LIRIPVCGDDPSDVLTPLANSSERKSKMQKILRITFVFALICLISIQIFPAQSPVKKFLTSDGSRPAGLFAPGVIIGKTVYVAGKGDYRPNEELPGKVRNCLAEVEKTLKVGGLNLSNVVRPNAISRIPFFPKFNEVYSKFFRTGPRLTLRCAERPRDSRIESR
jgi:enamine deaminase RidA (YjgF/YER057c/UK114 family)